MDNDQIGANSAPGDADLGSALAIIKSTRGKSFVNRFKALGLDPKTGFAGGDWRNCNFENSDLTDCDFRNTRLFRANFKHALVTGANFRGAGDVHSANIHLAHDWRYAEFDDYQIVLIEAQLARMIEYLDGRESLRIREMSDKQWFFAIKACPSFLEARDVLEQMEAAGYPLSPFAYSYVLDRAKRDRQRPDGWQLFINFLDRGGEPDEALYTAGMGVAPDSLHARNVFAELRDHMHERGEIPGERAYNMAISEQDDNFTAALGIFHEMKRKDVKVSRYTIYALFDACADFANAVTVLMEARKAGVDINDETFLGELSNTTRYPDLSDDNIREWQTDGLPPGDIIVRLIELLTFDPFRTDALAALS